MIEEEKREGKKKKKNKIGLSGCSGLFDLFILPGLTSISIGPLGLVLSYFREFA